MSPVPDVSSRTIAELVSLDGKVAVVTGGTKGTGAGIARRLAEAGATVVATDPAGVDGPHLDLRDEASVVAFVDELGPVDIWVNNEGAYPGTPALEMTGEQWDDVVDLNLRGAFLGAREAARTMVAAGRPGVIVNVGSTASFRASAAAASHYVSSKFGLRGLTQALAVELGPHGIRVLGVAPTFTVSPGTRERRSDLTDEEFDAYLQSVGSAKPLGRVGVPDDVGRVVLFCVSDLAAFMTGATLPVDAGDLAR